MSSYVGNEEVSKTSSPCFDCDKLDWCDHPCDEFKQWAREEREK